MHCAVPSLGHDSLYIPAHCVANVEVSIMGCNRFCYPVTLSLCAQ